MVGGTFIHISPVAIATAMSAFSPIQMLEATLLRHGYNRKQIFPKVWGKKVREEFEGAFVFEPDPNLYEWVASFDFASLYPFIMRQFMISIENFIVKDKSYVTTDKQIKTVSGAVFDASFEPLIPEILSDYYNQRKTAKKVSQTADIELQELKRIKSQRMKAAI